MNEKISIVTDEISQDLAECETFLAEHDLHAVELRCISDRRVPEVAAKDRGRLLDWARQGHPFVVAVSPGLFKCNVDDQAELERHLRELLPRTLELAVELGAENLISFTFDAGARDDVPGHALDALRGAAEACADAGVPLLLENEPGYLGSSAARTVRLIRQADHPNLFVNWDPTNGNEFSSPELAAAVEAITPWLRNVHVKNGRLPPGEQFARCCELSAGEIDWRAHLEQLAAIGYDGFFCLETHFLPARDGSARNLAELREMLAAVHYEWPEEE